MTLSLIARARSRRSPRAALVIALLGLSALPACGGSGAVPASAPFIAEFPSEGPGGGSTPPTTPPPSLPVTPIWDPAAVSLDRTALFGSFSSDLVDFETSLFVTDADAVEGGGAFVRAFDLGGTVPVPSTRFTPVHVRAIDLIDSLGGAGDAASPIGFGFFLNDLLVTDARTGFVLASAGGSDSVPACSNLVVFDPTAGTLRQVVDLAIPFTSGAPLLDSTGAAVPGQRFTQSGAEGLAYVPVTASTGVLFVAMSNFVFGAPSYGAVKYPGTVEVYDVDLSLGAPVRRRATATLLTQTILTHGFNPSAVTAIRLASGAARLLVTVAGTTGYDASSHLVPLTPAAVEVYDAATLSFAGSFDLGLAGLASSRPALGTDAAGHHIAALASSVKGEVYLLRTDGLYEDPIDTSKVAVLRGPKNGIAIDSAAAGGPGGNVAGLAISSDGRTLVASGFGDLFAFPAPLPGRLYALTLPNDVLLDAAFTRTFVAGTTRLVTATGTTLGPVVIHPTMAGAPEVFAAVSGAIDSATFLGTGPAHVGTLRTFSAIR